jgi:hypothetical protein
MRRTLLVSFTALLAACDPSGPSASGLGTTVRAGGPVVVWDIAHKPLPEIPLPNDQATRLDPTSPTGRRVNVGTQATTRYETKIRGLFDRLDGFGAFAPITVRFDQPLDLKDIVTRQANDDFRDDPVYLLNVDRRCQHFGEEVAIDFGRGHFPQTLMGHSQHVADAAAPHGFLLDEGGNKLFPFDPRGDSLNVLFPDHTEDLNGNGVLDPGEDTNDDGVLDEANFVDPHACDAVPFSTPAHDRCVADNLMTWYERSTNTLILRPVWPMEERCTYAVVLTNRLKGANGKPVESPFPKVQPVDQIAAVAPVSELLPRYGLTTKDVSFTWSFTVGTMTKDLEQLRAGLYGSGPFQRLAKEFPVSGFDVFTRDQWRTISGEPPRASGGSDRLISGGCAAATYAAIGGTGDGDKQICGGYADYAGVGGFFGGQFEAPNFLVDKDGLATPLHPADDDESWDVKAEEGTGTYGHTQVTFWCALPREDAKPAGVTCTPGNPEGQPWCKPYPVVFFAHGYGSFKGEFVQHAGRHATMGMAACGLDSYGHGRSVVFKEGCPGWAEFTAGQGQLDAFGASEIATMIYYGRDRDLNNDGCPEGGADQWTANLFHTRDIVRQSVLEEMQFVRMLHAMDGTARDLHGNVLGDVDGDGKPDIGGRTNLVTAWGISLGGQITAVTAGAEPALDAVVPNAVGAGLTDISVRLGEGGLAEAVMLPVQGPVLVGCLPTDEHQNPLSTGTKPTGCLPSTSGSTGGDGPQPAGELLLAWYAHDTALFNVRPFARVAGVAPNDLVKLENLDKGISSTAIIGARGFVRTQVAADALGATERRAILGFTDEDNTTKTATDTTKLGDRLRITVLDGKTGATKSVVDQWGWDVTFQNTLYPQGQPLVALQEGLGYPRNSPDFRRFYGIAQHVIAPADPAVWSRRYFDDPIQAPYDPAWRAGRNHVIMLPTIGDPEVPAATGVALGRSSGMLGSFTRDPDHFSAEHGWRELFTPDPRYGKSIDQWLIDNYVVEGDWRMQRWASYGVNPNVLFDPDDVSDGTAAFSCLHSADWSADDGEFRCPMSIDNTDVSFGVPHPEAGHELRRNRPRADGTWDAFRMPLLRPAGQHGIYNPQPFRKFDADAYMVNFTARYMASHARNVTHEPGCDCAYAARPHFVVHGEPAWPGVEDVAACPDDDTAYGKACSTACDQGWGLATLPPTVCNP